MPEVAVKKGSQCMIVIKSRNGQIHYIPARRSHTRSHGGLRVLLERCLNYTNLVVDQLYVCL